MIGLPLEVNVVIKKPENIVSSACVTNDCRTDKTDDTYIAKGEKNDLTPNTNDRRHHMSVHHNFDFKRRESDGVTVIYVREKEPDLTLSYEKEMLDHAKISSIRTDLSQKHGLDNVVIDLDSTTTMEAKNANQCNDFDVGMPDHIENNTSSKASQSIVQDENVSSEEVKKNETANTILNELYDKKLKLENKFSDQEIKDICAAVLQHVTLLAKSIGETDLRLRFFKMAALTLVHVKTLPLETCVYTAF